MESYILSLGLIAVFLGVILEGEFLFLTGVMFANTGHLDLTHVLIAGYLGIMTHDWLFYTLGKTQGKSFFDQRPKLNKRLDKVLVPFYKNDWIFFLSYRFLIGFRMILIILFGISDVPKKKFLLASTFGGILWIAFYGGIGVYFTEVVLDNLEWFKKHKLIIFFAAVALMLIYILPKLLGRPSDE